MLKEIAVSLGIAVIFPFLLFFGVNTIVPKPDETESFNRQHDLGFKELSEKEQERIKIEDAVRFEEYFKEYIRNERIWFYTSLVLGYSALVAGALIIRTGVGSGFMFGGIISLGLAYLRASNMDYLNNDLTSASLLFGVFLLVFIGLKVFKNRRAEQVAGGDGTR